LLWAFPTRAILRVISVRCSALRRDSFVGRKVSDLPAAKPLRRRACSKRYRCVRLSQLADLPRVAGQRIGIVRKIGVKTVPISAIGFKRFPSGTVMCKRPVVFPAPSRSRASRPASTPLRPVARFPRMTRSTATGGLVMACRARASST